MKKILDGKIINHKKVVMSYRTLFWGSIEIVIIVIIVYQIQGGKGEITKSVIILKTVKKLNTIMVLQCYGYIICSDSKK